MNEDILAFYMGYAFSHAIHTQHLLEHNALMVPFVVYWQHMQSDSVPYSATTQVEALEKAHSARAQREAEVTGWSSGREGTIQQNDGSKLDVVLIEGWVPGLTPPLEMFVYCRKTPFRLIQGLFWKPHHNARKNTQAFMAKFKDGILGHPFGKQCLQYVERAEPVNFVSQ
ncbi:hypothetical protein ACO0LK_14745 [Undibacterium sp. Ji49W]